MKFFDISRIRSRFDERVVVRDGTELSVDLYLPSEPGSYPVLVARTPYDNNRMASDPSGTKLLPAPADRYKKIAAHGYVVVAADVRGRGDSDGDFIPFVNEACDGADTVTWARDLEESNGRIGVFGQGYGGFCAWAAAVEDAHVDAILTISPFGAPLQGIPYRGGALRLDWLFWMHLVGGRTLQKVDVPQWAEIFKHLPVSELDEALGRQDIWWKEWLDEAASDRFWTALDLTERIAALDVPALHVTGWWDQNLAATRWYWDAARRSMPNGQYIVIGPWDTQAVRSPHADVGGIDWGPSSVLDPDELLLRWFAEQFAGDERHQRHPARIFVTGRNDWEDFPEWPLPSQSRKLWLSSGGNANTRRGDGILLDSAPQQESADEYTYNPEDPLTWQPHFSSFSVTAPTPFILDEAHATGRDDALCYTSSPLEAPITVLGTPRVELYAETSAHDTDWVASISDVFPLEGRSVHLGHAIVRARTQEGFESNAVIRYILEFDDIGHEFLAGHSIRLVLTSSLFPLYARNLGSDESYVHAHHAQLAEQRICHGPDNPSRLILPIIN